MGLSPSARVALLVSMIWAAAIAYMLDRRFLHAAGWLFAGAVLCCFGFIHAYTLTPQGIENRIGFLVTPAFTISYVASALFLAGCHWYARQAGAFLDEPTDLPPS